MEGFPEDVKQFILAHIDSVEQLEALLLLVRNPEKDWTAEAVSKELYTQPESAAAHLTKLRSLDLLKRTEGGGPLYRYAPRTHVQDRLLARLAEAYKERPVSVITMIYSKPLSQVQAFADAFKFRKET